MAILSGIYKNTRSKNPILNTGLSYKRRNYRRRYITKKYKKCWVSATQTYNYMLKDSLVDWLKFRSKNKKVIYKENEFIDFIKKRGIEFEEKIVNYINNNITNVKYVSDIISEESCKKTIKYMKEGHNIIHSAPFMCNETYTKGIIDLLVRSDFIKNIVKDSPMPIEYENIKSFNNLPYHYVVIDIKFSTLPLKSDGIHILNSSKYPAYKAQTYIYNSAIGKIQGYTPRFAFILGRRYKYKHINTTYSSNNCLDKLGVIDFQNKDKEYPEISNKAIDWVRDVKNNGNKWKVNPPSKNELYPNMCIDSGVWQKEKQKIANNIGEITNIWCVGIKNRNIALDNGIKSWKENKCNTINIKINGKRAKTINKIMYINRHKSINILPNKIKTNICNWKKTQNEIFVDFETISDVFGGFDNLPIQEKSEMIFMIGVGWEKNNKWTYKKFICKNLSIEEEYKIMNEFYKFIKTRNFPKINYWCAEKKFWTIAENKLLNKVNTLQAENIRNNWKNIHNYWVDLCILFKSEPIVIKNCFNFSLKNIAKAMYNHKMISTKIESNCDSGMSAMIQAWNCYNNNENVNNSKIMKDITKYNQFDCKVLWDILSYLRKNHS